MEDQQARLGAWMQTRIVCKGPTYETPLATLYRIWSLITPETQLWFLREVLTAEQKQALAHSSGEESTP